jgi:hypothetical protein
MQRYVLGMMPTRRFVLKLLSMRRSSQAREVELKWEESIGLEIADHLLIK